MAKTKVVLNHAGFNEMLHSAPLASGLASLAADMAARAGDGYASDTRSMPSRVIAGVYPATPSAMRNELENNTLLKMVQS